MKKYTSKLIFAMCLLAFVPGCSILAPKSPITWEASRYLAFNDVWDVTHATYQVFKNKQALGGVSPDDAIEVDRAWNAFRSAYIFALDAAGNNSFTFTPDNVRALANDVLILVAAL